MKEGSRRNNKSYKKKLLRRLYSNLYKQMVKELCPEFDLTLGQRWPCPFYFYNTFFLRIKKIKSPHINLSLIISTTMNTSRRIMTDLI